MKPIIKLANVILLIVIKKRPDAFRIRRDGSTSVVEHLFAGEIVEDSRGPTVLFTDVIRRVSVMANLPLHPKGTVACGRIHLKVRTESHYFGIEVSGHGPALELRGYLLSEAELHANE